MLNQNSLARTESNYSSSEYDHYNSLAALRDVFLHDVRLLLGFWQYSRTQIAVSQFWMFSSLFPTWILGAFGSATRRINKNEDMTEMRTCRVPQNPSKPFSPLNKIEERGSEMISEELTSGNTVNMRVSRCFVVCNGSIQDGFHRDQGDRPWWIWSNHAVRSSIGRNGIRCRDWSGSVP